MTQIFSSFVSKKRMFKNISYHETNHTTDKRSNIDVILHFLNLGACL